MRLTFQMCLLTTLLIAVASAVLSLASPKAQPPQPAAIEIKIDNFSFNPSQLKIAVGTQVTWINRDDIPHTIVATDRAFKSGVLDTGDKFSHQFTTPGTYTYFCSVHPKMTGQIQVQ